MDGILIENEKELQDVLNHKSRMFFFGTKLPKDKMLIPLFMIDRKNKQAVAEIQFKRYHDLRLPEIVHPSYGWEIAEIHVFEKPKDCRYVRYGDVWAGQIQILDNL